MKIITTLLDIIFKIIITASAIDYYISHTQPNFIGEISIGIVIVLGVCWVCMSAVVYNMEKD